MRCSGVRRIHGSGQQRAVLRVLHRGSLDTGAVLSEDAEWYVSVNFEQDELLFSLDAFGNLVYFGSAPEED